MKKEEPPPIAGKLTIVRPFRARKTASDRPIAFDIVAFCCNVPTEISNPEPPLRDRWLQRLLPEAFPDSRILAYKHALKTPIDPQPTEDDTLALEFLGHLLHFRRSTNTVRVQLRLCPSNHVPSVIGL
jgi:hypothetical protein